MHGASLPNVLRSALVGVVFAVDATGHCLALAAIFFSGGLASGLGLATALFLAATVVSTIQLLVWSGFRLSFGIAQDTSVAILAPAATLAVAGLAGPEAARVATVLAVIACATLLSGAAFWVVGRFGLGQLARMFPYPVTAGFLASSGLLLVNAAITIATGSSGFQAVWDSLSRTHVQVHLGATLAFALTLFTLVHLRMGVSALLVALAIYLPGFYLVTAQIGIDRPAAEAMGLIPLRHPEIAIGFDLSTLALVDWGVVAQLGPTLGAVVLLNLIGILLNTTGVALATRTEVEVDRELRLAGLANLGIGLFGGLTSFLQGGTTIIVSKLGVNARAAVLGHIALLLLALGFADLIVASVPVFIAAGLLMFIGLSMLEDWLVTALRRLVLLDRLVVLAILFVTIFAGILPAIAFGFVLAVFNFAFSYARLPVVRKSSTGKNRRSIRDWSPEEEEILNRLGHTIRILHLHGALFFGSVEKMVADTLRDCRAAGDTAFLVLDFSEVQSFDSSACAAFEKLGTASRALDIEVSMVNLAPGLLDLFTRWGLPVAPARPAQQDGAHGEAVPGFRLFDTLDDALESCEAQLLARNPSVGSRNGNESLLSDLCRDHPATSRLVARFEPLVLADGDVLIRASDTSRDIYFLEAGQLAVLLPVAHGAKIKIRKMGPGAFVGEIARMLGTTRSADVVAEGTCRVLRLPDAAIRDIEESDTETAALLYSVIARAMSVKVLQTNRLMAYGSDRANGR